MFPASSKEKLFSHKRKKCSVDSVPYLYRFSYDYSKNMHRVLCSARVGEGHYTKPGACEGHRK